MRANTCLHIHTVSPEGLADARGGGGGGGGGALELLHFPLVFMNRLKKTESLCCY